MSPLDTLQLARPCPKKWSAMKGDARTRFCTQCAQHVFNLAELSAAEARTLIAQKEGLVCVRVFRRADGTVITRDCRGGFSENFWKKFATFQRLTVIGFALAVVLSFTSAVIVTLFGDNLRVLFLGGETGALAGDPDVKPKGTRRLPADHGHGDSY